MNIREQIEREKRVMEVAVIQATNDFTKATGIKIDRIIIDQSTLKDANGNVFVEYNSITTCFDW